MSSPQSEGEVIFLVMRDEDKHMTEEDLAKLRQDYADDGVVWDDKPHSDQEPS